MCDPCMTDQSLVSFIIVVEIRIIMLRFFLVFFGEILSLPNSVFYPLLHNQLTVVLSGKEGAPTPVSFDCYP